jgi:hypothetical protein
MEMSDLDVRRRLAVLATLLAVLISVPSSLAFVAPYRFDLDAVLTDPGSIVDGGAGAAALFHWGAIGDMLYSYVLLVPLALYLHGLLRPRKPWLADLGTLGALAYIVVGASGAVMLASAGASLIEAYATAAAPDQFAISTSFHALANLVFFGLWQTLDPIGLGTWLLSVGWLIRPDRRALGMLLVVFGVGLLAASVRTMLGLTGLNVLVGGVLVLVLAWALWVAIDRAGQRDGGAPSSA